MNQIEDGTGSGNRVKVDGENRLLCAAVSESEQAHHTRKGASYNLNTGEITLTTATESAIMYFKNNEERNFVVTAIAVGLGPSTDGVVTDIPLIKVTRNPTGGTIVSSPTNVDINSNRNFGSSNILTADVYKGAEGNTITGDTDHLLLYQSAGGRLLATIDEVLPKGTSMGITITPQASNSSMTCYAALIGYVEEDRA